jgi:hypothetical protein
MTKQIIAALSIRLLPELFHLAEQKAIEINNSTCTVEEISESLF